MRDYPGPHHGTPVLPWLFFVVFVALVALAAYALARGFRPTAPAVAALPAEGDALAIVRLRYARGELSRDEYLQATADLGGAPPA
jgi:uncharacterized membrane protein